MEEENSKVPPRPYYLRKLRRGVTLSFYTYDHDGIPQWMLYDATQNKRFIMGWPEREMLSRWHLGNPGAIVDAVNRETTLHIDIKDFEQLENFLNRHYLLEQRWRNVYQKAKEQKVIKSENIFYWFIRYYLFFRVPLFHPDNFLNKTRWIGNLLFSRYTLIIMTLLGILAIYQINLHWEDFTHTFASIFNWQGLIFYFIAFTIAKFFHEFGHAYMCKQYNVPVPTMGVAFLVFWPVLYTDTTASWTLPSHKRIWIALAGMWVETYVTIFAALIWANTHNLIIQMICYITVAINWVSTLLINVSPFMRFDGYYIFSDLLKMPNLQNRAFAIGRWQIRKWLFDWDEPQIEKYSKRMHRILVTYAFVTWTYRLIIYFGIALLVYHYFFKLLGIILFLIELFAFILRPIVQEFQTWYDLRRQFTMNKRTVITCICAVIILILLLLPLSQVVKMNATLTFSHQLIYATQDSTLLTKLPSAGTHVKNQEIIAELQSPELEHNLKKVELEYNKILVEVRRASFNPAYSNQLSTLQGELEQKKAQYNKLLKLKEELIVRAPFDGVIADIHSELSPGDTVSKNALIADVINPQFLVVEAYAEQSDLSFLKLNATGHFYPSNLDEPSVPIKLIAIEPVNVPQLSVRYAKETREDVNKPQQVASPSYNASELGGKIATNISEKGTLVPVESVYRVLLVPEKPINLQQTEVGTAMVNTSEPRSILFQFFYKLKKIFIKETGF